MTSGFLNAIASYYFQNSKTELSKFCFVFPSQRAGIFFTNHLRQYIQSPIWSPNTITINDLFSNLSNLVVADNITLLFNLHQVYKEITQKDVSFEEFLPWGEMFLNDFDDIDKYLVEADQLFSNLLSLKELDDDYSHLSDKQREAIQSFWSTFDTQKRSEHQNYFLETWKQIPEVYLAFQKRLKSQGIAYEGMVYRQIAELIKDEKHIYFEWDKIIFVGLNALTPAEIKLMNYLKKRDIASFFWDYSSWMINSESDDNKVKRHGPGFFIEENLFRFPHPKDFNMPMSKEAPEITITAVANPTEQLKSVHQFLEKEYISDMKSAVILADETLLMPALHGIPTNVDRVNVTMGYPLNNTPAYGLIEALLNLQQQVRLGSANEVWLYHRHVLPLLQHQYISMLAEVDCLVLHKKLVSRNYIFIKSTELQINSLFKLIFKKVEGGNELASYLIEILSKVYELLKQSEEKIIEQEFIFAIHKSIVRLQDLLEQNQQADLDSKTWVKLFKKLADYQTVPFRGEPLAGLQVMGILETRALDFDKLIILDLNEGVFPRTSPPNTFIPATLRAGFELPTIEFQDAIFSYYFFRLIHRAKKVELLYSTGAQGMKSSEMSRYLYQLKYEFNASIKQKTTTGKVSLMSAPLVKADKNVQVLEQLEKFTNKGDKILSPSALSVYIECPLRFYYQKIANIKEPDVITEEADARIFGLIFHDVVEKLYENHKNKEVTSENIDHWLKNIAILDALIKEGFNTHIMDYEKGRKSFTEIHGKNVMVFEVIKRYLIQFLKIEKKNTPFTIIDLEKSVNWLFTTSNGREINLGGIIDRLEEKDGIIKVMDYKTGSGAPSVDDIADLFNTDKHKKNKAIFQTLLYSLILDETSNETKQLQPSVIWVRDVFKSDYDTKLYLKEKRNLTPIFLQAVKEEFKSGLDALVNEIYDDTISFEPCEDIEKCKFCTYKSLCNR
ncbi:PD-(D/E)XK nuclease family protein [Carboxylicivirga sp. N1Y90]|uniref:PD-(D/E)XK nuclease family protein n=1 Tax=Carboxylicivirga fragile TaxID=3417571 RepID=UPI003D334DB4|nr:PD-(D/E)XK nuclease family protein [Marinilabiliaceae bacterium N1Y90]